MADNPLADYKRRYNEAGHKVQTAVAFLMGNDPHFSLTQPKHMRVGIDMQKSDLGAIATLLIEKGVFTEVEYYEKMADFAEREAAAFETMVQAVMSARNIPNYIVNKNLFIPRK